MTPKKLPRKNKCDVNSQRENYKEIIKYNKLILKLRQRFRIKKHSVFTEEFYKIALSDNYDKNRQSINSIETYAYRKRKGLVCKKEEITWSSIIQQYKND